MSKNTTNTYQSAKEVFDTLGFKEQITIDISERHIPIFRKHLAEMVKRKGSQNRYATRALGSSLMIIRIQ